MPLKLPKVIGHRGACAYAPENTLESIRTAAELGCTWVEFDVQITKDGVPVLIKDETLDRTTNGHGNVIDHTLADLNDLECGSWFGGSFGDIKIPTLEEAIDVLCEQNLGVTIDIQARQGRDVDTSEAILDVLTRSWDEPDRLLLTTPSIAALETCMDMAPDFRSHSRIS
jgi:glycerophosphoryl diester phosphodiesterase